MATSDKAKELAAKQKAQIKAEKLRKKNSTNPRDWGYVRQLTETYKRTAEIDSKLTLWTVLAATGAFALIAVLGVLSRMAWWAWLPLALLSAVLGALIVLVQRAKKAAFTRAKGQPGSAQVALGLLNKKKYSHDLGIAADRELDLVHRVVGPCGIVLVGEGQAGRTRKLLATEAKKHEQVAYGVTVTQLMVGDADNQVKLESLSKYIEKMPKVLESYQIAEVNQRLRALDAVRPKVPMPKGPVPTPKGVNRALRGR